MLAGLRSAGIPLGVVTVKGRSAWEVTEKEVFIREAEAHQPYWFFERPADLVRAFAAWC